MLQTGRKTLVLAGGVAANSHIRKTAEEVCKKCGKTLYLPPLSLCGDCGAMSVKEMKEMAGLVRELMALRTALAEQNGERVPAVRVVLADELEKWSV